MDICISRTVKTDIVPPQFQAQNNSGKVYLSMPQKPISKQLGFDYMIEESGANELGDAIRKHFSSLYKMNPEAEVTKGGSSV